MNAESKVKAPTVEQALNDLRIVGVHRKLSAARQRFHTLKLKKTGKNTFAGYDYFELGDFLVPALQVFDEVGLGAIVSFDRDTATMTIVDLDNTEDRIIITSPMGSAALKGCHEVQNIGAVETYQRRYLWVAALEIVEHDALDKTTGKAEPVKRAEPKADATKISQADFERIKELAPKAGKSLSDLEAAYKVSGLLNLTADQGRSCIARLEKLAKEPADA